MPNMMKPEKKYFSIRIMRNLYWKLTQEADDRGITRSDYAQQILSEAMENVVLRKEYRDKVIKEIAEVKKSRGIRD